VEIGVTFDVIVLAFGLGDRIRGMALKREHAEAVATENRRLARTDALTGIPNRRVFDEQLDADWSRACERGEALSLLMVDIDSFKLFNDLYGHLEGDECLRRIAETGFAVIGNKASVFARYGGEEFAAVLPGVDSLQAESLAHALREAIAALRIPHAASQLGYVSVSVGVGTLPGRPDGASSTLVDTADHALYAAKARRGNTVCAFAPIMRTSPGSSS
jgi:diguanylate cyclase (GGDEF)-like protein